MSAEEVLARTKRSSQTFFQIVNPLTIGFAVLNISLYWTIHGMNYQVIDWCSGGLLVWWRDCFILIPDQRFLFAYPGIILSIGLMMWYIRDHQRWAFPIGIYLITVYPGHIFRATHENIVSVCSYPGCDEWILGQYYRHHQLAFFCIFLGITLLIYSILFFYNQLKESHLDRLVNAQSNSVNHDFDITS